MNYLYSYSTQDFLKKDFLLCFHTNTNDPNECIYVLIPTTNDTDFKRPISESAHLLKS